MKKHYLPLVAGIMAIAVTACGGNVKPEFPDADKR